MQNRTVIRLALLLAPLAFLAAAPATQPANTTEDLLKSAPYKPAATDMVLHDAKRNKDLNIKVRYPTAAKGPLPVVIFSHGLGGAGNTFADLTTHWASRGYVVILPTHSDSIALRRKNGEPTPTLADRGPALKSLMEPMDRLADIKLILDQLDAVETEITGKSTGAGKLLDRENIAMAGHSAGAFTTEMIIGTKLANPLTSKELAFGDPRIKCGILVSGQGTATKTLKQDSWSDITLPMLVITGSLDKDSITEENPESRQEPYKFAKPGEKYLLFITGATHGSYGGNAMANILQEKPTTDVKVIGDAVSAATTAFLDGYLKKDEGAKAYLKTDALPKSSGGKATLEHK